MVRPDSAALSRMVNRASQGDSTALSELVPQVYEELRKLARNYMKHEQRRSLQPTALVHEVYLRLLQDQNLRWENRAHFLALTARAMRQVLVERARAKRAKKRGGGAMAITLDESLVGRSAPNVDILALDDALNRLAVLDPQQSEVVELRYFGGLTIEETAAAMDISPATVKRWWQLSKAWLRLQLTV